MLIEWFKAKLSSPKPCKTKRETLGEVERGELVKVHLKPSSYFNRCYPNGTPRLDQQLINEGLFIGSVVNCSWREKEKIWILTVSVGRRNGPREYLFLEDEIENIRKVNTNDL